MDIVHEYISRNVAVIRLIGDLDVYSAVKVRESFVSAVSSGQFFLVVDMRCLEFLDSTGLGVLVGAFKRCRVHGGNIVIIPGRLTHLGPLTVTGLFKVFRIFNDMTTAIDAVSCGDSNQVDPPGPHEFRPRNGSLVLEIYTADPGESLRLRASLLAFLEEFAIESVFQLPDHDGYDIRQSVLVISAPVSRNDQIRVVCDTIKRRVNKETLAGGTGGGAIEGLVATLRETREATIRLESALIAYAGGELVARIFDSRLAAWEFIAGHALCNCGDCDAHNFRDPKEIASALRSSRGRPIHGRLS